MDKYRITFYAKPKDNNYLNEVVTFEIDVETHIDFSTIHDAILAWHPDKVEKFLYSIMRVE